MFDTIKSLCDEKSITIFKLEKDLGFSNGAIRRWRKSSPSVENLDKVADYFNVSIAYLLGKTDIRTPVTKLVKDNLPEELKDLDFKHIRLAKEMKDSDLDIEELRKAIRAAQIFADKESKNESSPT